MGMRGIYISSAAEYTEKNTNDFIVRFCVNYTICTIIHPGHTPFFLSFGSFLFKSFWRQERRFLRSRIRRRRSSSTSTAPAAPHEYKHITLWSICSFNIDHVDRGINQLWMSLTFSSSGGNRMTGRHQKKKRKKKRHGSSETTLSPRKATSIRIGPGWHWPISFVLFTQKRRKFALKVIK